MLAVEAEGDRLGGQRRAVVELDARAQVEDVLLAVGGDVPLLGQGGLDVGAVRLVAHQAFVHGGGGDEAFLGIHGGWIEAIGVAAPEEGQRVGRAGGRRGGGRLRGLGRLGGGSGAVVAAGAGAVVGRGGGFAASAGLAARWLRGLGAAGAAGALAAAGGAACGPQAASSPTPCQPQETSATHRDDRMVRPSSRSSRALRPRTGESTAPIGSMTGMTRLARGQSGARSWRTPGTPSPRIASRSPCCR